MSWKNFLFFSEGEKNGILVLICLVVVAIVINRILPCYFSDKPADMSDYHAEIEHFKASLIPGEKQVELFSFDPNRLDSADFVRLGVPSYLVSRILKYRSKGGVFRKPEDFSKIYGMQEELYAELLPYISIEKEMKSESVFSKNKKKEKEVALQTEEYTVKEIEIIELNTADAATLKKLKGIGTIYAERIVKYRNYLGGFYQIEQLKEVYGISEELFQSLRPYLTVDNSEIKKIRLNGNVNIRLRHPYLKKEQLSALILFLQKNKTISTFETLKEINEFSDEDWERLIPYLSLE
ncbi:MAG: helix-hairpin-helix domain-containing protein [Prevotellaceae bacterium]|jgi:competence ComEA-like helix-hairpin-helix protein|nr:helix-hairpin-helix domain-containing protein [Prevotellaceae bacterium]